MKRSEFYEKICQLPLNCELLDFYESLHQVVQLSQNKVPSWETIIEVLDEAFSVANGKKLVIENVELSESNVPDKESLLRFLRSKIDFLKANGIPKNHYDGTNISYDDTNYNWNIAIILERGAAWMTEGDEEDLPFDEQPTWETIAELISIGIEYE